MQLADFITSYIKSIDPWRFSFPTDTGVLVISLSLLDVFSLESVNKNTLDKLCKQCLCCTLGRDRYSAGTIYLWVYISTAGYAFDMIDNGIVSLAFLYVLLMS